MAITIATAFCRRGLDLSDPHLPVRERAFDEAAASRHCLSGIEP